MLKQKRKTIALICMILIGILGSFLFTNHSDVVYAEEFNVNANTLSVKCQLSTNAKATDDTTRMRLVSTISEGEVEKLSYVGFEIEFLADDNAKAVTMSDINNTVYAGITIDSTDEQGVSYDFTPKAFDMNSKYFSTCTISGIPQVYFDNGILIKPFVVERGLDPKVVQNREYGEHRYIKIMDVLSTNDKIMSVPVLGDASDETNVQLDGKSCTVIEKYFDGTYTHVRIAQDPKQLASVTEITVGDKPATYRNLYSTVANDTSWHEDGKGGVIITQGDLYGFQKLSADDESFADETVYLAADIDLNPTWTSSPEAPTNIWTPIKNFTGTFDGGGRTIKGVYVSGESHVGFFDTVSERGTVQNLLLKNSYINATATGHTYAGAIAAFGQGTFSNIYSDATVYSTGYNVGGLVGICNDNDRTAEVSFTNCWNAGAVRGTSLVGGLFGYADGCKSISVSNCLNTGTICEAGVGNQVGGLCGKISAAVTTGTINNSLNTGTVYGNNLNQGAIIGNDTASIANIFSNVYYLDGCCTHKGGGVISKSGVSAISANNLKSEVGYTNTSLPLAYWEYVKGGTPELRMFSEADTKLSWYLEGEDKDTFEYKISNVAELKGFSYFSKKDNFSGDIVKLTNNIYMNEGWIASATAPSTIWEPIGELGTYSFAGIFDGNGKTISGLYHNSSTMGIGLFRSCAAGSVIKNFTLKNSYFESTNTTNAIIGSIAGRGYGSYENIVSEATIKSSGDRIGGLLGQTTGTVTITNCEYNGNINSSNNYVGGMVGYPTANVTITNSECGGTITSSGTHGAGFVGYSDKNSMIVNITGCDFSGTITSGNYCGGFIAQSKGLAEIENSQFTGTINGKAFVGGFIGWQETKGDSYIKHCLNSGTITTTDNQVGGFVGCVNGVKFTIDDCLLTGETPFIANKYKYLIIGRVAGAANITVSNVFAKGTVDQVCIGLNSTTAMVNDTAIVFTNANDLKDKNAYIKTSLNFTSYWRAVANDYPELQEFEGSVAILLPTGVARADYSWYSDLAYTNNSEKYILQDANDLMGFAILSQMNNFTGETIQLGDNDIVLNSSTEWIPIGNSTYPFAGTFDGNGKEITGLMKTTAAQTVGFFSEVSGANIKDISIAGSLNVLSNSGGLIGKCQGTTNIQNVYLDVDVASTGFNIGGLVGNQTSGTLNISNATSAGNVSSTYGDVKLGGFVGDALGNVTIINSECTGILTSGNYCGGFIARSKGLAQIENSRFAGTINGKAFVGGFIGWQETTGDSYIKHCLNSGTITTTDNQVGGYVGCINGVKFTIDDCLLLGDTPFISNKWKHLLIGRVAGAANITVSNVFAKGTVDQVCIGLNSTTAMLNDNSVIITNESEIKGANAYAKTTLDFNNYWRLVDGEYPELLVFAKKSPESAKADYNWFNNVAYTANGNKYILSDANDLMGFANISQSYTFEGKTVFVGDSDITLNAEWQPIGNETYQFAGVFDGNNHAVRGLAKSTAAQNVGFFACVSGATIKNLTIEGSFNTISNSGGLIGKCQGTTNIENVYADVDVNSSGFHVGGFIGNQTSGTLSILNSTSASNVSGSYNDNKIGGFIGNVQGTVTIHECVFAGTVSGKQYTGGFIGNQTGTVVMNECSLDGTVSGTNLCGGFVGDVNASTKSCTVEHCIFTEDAQTTLTGNQVGGYVGRANAGTIIVNDCLLLGTTNAATKVGWNNLFIGRVGGATVTITNTYSVGKTDMCSARWQAGTLNDSSVIFTDANYLKGENAYTKTSLDYDYYWNAVKGGWPELKAFSEKEAMTLPTDIIRADYSWYIRTNYYDGETTNTYTILDASDLMGFAIVSQTDNFANETVQLGENDIVLNNTTEWVPIGNSTYPFAGTFDGNDHSIIGLTKSKKEQTVGFFKYVSGGTIRDLTITGTINALSNSGGLIGICTGTTNVENVYVGVDVISTGFNVGGFVGNQKSGTLNISNSWNAGDVTSSYENNTPNIGGFIGMTGADGQENVPNTIFTSCLNSGRVSGWRNFVSGFVGKGNSTMSYTDCLNTGTVVNTDIENASTISYPAAAFATAFYETTVVNSYSLDCVASLFRNQNVYVKGYASMLDEASLTGANGYFNTELSDEKWNFVEGGLPELHMHSSKTEAIKPEFRYDTSWYGDGSASTFTLSDAGDLYGFSRISQITNFAGKTILLDSNITVNSGDATTWGNNEPAYEWIPISAFGDAKEFAGTFDGQMHTISGLYRKSATRGIALFVGTTGTSTVKNLRIENSYFHYDGFELQSDGYVYPGYVASVAAWGNGNFENIYSSATIVSEGNCAGGIIAAVNKYVSAEHRVKKCWFDGTVTLKKHEQAQTNLSDNKQNSFYAGGILGQVVNDNIECQMVDCLNTGTITGSLNYVGGLCGYVADSGKLSITDSLNAGTVSGNHMKRICSIVGTVEAEIKNQGKDNEDDQRSTLCLENVYSLKGKAQDDTFYHEYDGEFSDDKSTYISGAVTVLTEDQLSGETARTNAESLFEENGVWKIVTSSTPVLDFTWK